MTKHDDTETLRTPGVRSLEELPLDRVRQLAADGPDAKTRADAKRELEARLAAAEASPAPELTVRVSASDFGTPRPEVVVTMPAGTPYRALRAQLHEVAAEVERTLAPTREGWVVELRRVDDYVGAVHLELMHGTAAEVDRAKVVLAAVLGSVPPDGTPPRQPRKRDLRAERERRKAREAAGAEAASSGEQAVPEPPSHAAPTPANDAELVPMLTHADEREARRGQAAAKPCKEHK